MSDVTAFNTSTFLAARAIEAADMGPPPKPKIVALPGAKAAISHDLLLAHQASGKDQHAIVQRINERWAAENADRLASHHHWTARYADAVAESRRRQEKRLAEDQRRRAILEQMIAEWEG